MQYKEVFTKKRPCPFDHPLAGDIVTSNDSAFVTYALAPYHRDHLLVVPWRHVTHINKLTEEELSDIDALLDKLWVLYKKKLKYRAVSFLLREGKRSGASVAHLHYHIIPDTRIGDIEHDWANREILTPKKKANQVERIKKLL